MNAEDIQGDRVEGWIDQNEWDIDAANMKRLERNIAIVGLTALAGAAVSAFAVFAYNQFTKPTPRL